MLVRGLDQDDYFNGKKKEYLDPNKFFNIVIKLGKCVKLQKNLCNFLFYLGFKLNLIKVALL